MEQEDMGGGGEGRSLFWLNVIKEYHFLGPSCTDFCDVKLK